MDLKKLSPNEFWKSIGCPKMIVAPMVDHCDLAYRMMTRKYGAELVYTQMYNANAFVHSKELREQNFTTCAMDRPLIVQLAGHEPLTLLQAAKYVEHCCDAVDLNLGCPQGIAKRGRYGAFLMDEVDLLEEIVSTLAQGLSIPVTCKVRIYKDYDKNIKLCETLVKAGASALTIHGRTREEKGQLVREVDWDMVRRIKQYFTQRAAGSVPIIANGGIECRDDVFRCIELTGVDGVMSSEGLLENPALFTNSIDYTVLGMEENGLHRTQIDLTEEYLRYCQQYPVWHMKCVRSHVMKMLYRYICVHVELRDMIGLSTTLEAYFIVCAKCRDLIRDKPDSYYQCSWYRRYRQTLEIAEDGSEKIIHNPVFTNKDQMIDLKTSFITSSAENKGDEGNIWGAMVDGDGDNCDGGIFASLFDTN